MSKSIIEIKTAFDGCAEVCDMFRLDVSDHECMYTGICEKAKEAIAKLSGHDNPLDEMFADSFDKLNGFGVKGSDKE